eukprot:GHRR01005048.1.p1 GENE.GHRR01005048.1~~GHRR01005048.1.p1  ORF type:complete len:394 (+),score=129.56 GHRR01005048.1:100-1281(+)
MHLQPVANHRLQLGSNWQLTLCWPAQCAVHCKPHHRPAEAWPARAQPVSTRRVRPPGWHTTRCANHSTNLVALTEPLSTLDVDRELWAVLDLCSDEELESLYNILFGASPFSPIVKSIVKEDEPPLLQLRGRSSIMHKVESRFRFLAADSTATLRGKRPSYREALLLIRDRLEVQCSSNLSTQDLEAEIFLHVLQNCVEYVKAAGDPDPKEAAAVAYADGDGMTSFPAGQSPKSNWTERLTAPFKFGGRELLPPALKLTSAVTLTAVMRRTAAQLGRQLLRHHARYQAVAAAATSTASTAAATARGVLMTQWQRQAALAAAQKGLTSATFRYSAVQGALAFVGPIMWAWLAVDLMKAALGTDYARVVRAVYILAQVRLVATQGWSNPPVEGGV